MLVTEIDRNSQILNNSKIYSSLLRNKKSHENRNFSTKTTNELHFNELKSLYLFFSPKCKYTSILRLLIIKNIFFVFNIEVN